MLEKSMENPRIQTFEPPDAFSYTFSRDVVPQPITDVIGRAYFRETTHCHMQSHFRCNQFSECQGPFRERGDEMHNFLCSFNPFSIICFDFFEIMLQRCEMSFSPCSRSHPTSRKTDLADRGTDRAN
jgi:hypothetical protein